MENIHIVDKIFNHLNCVRSNLSNLETETFDLDTSDSPSVKVNTSKTFSQLKKEQHDVETFNNTLFYHGKKRSDKHFNKTGKQEKEMDIIDNISEIDNLDNGKSWKQLDNWMKKKKLIEYTININIEGYEQTILDLYNKGEFKKPSQVDYDSDMGIIKNLNSKLLVK